MFNPVGIPAVPHLHGGEVPPVLDGGPDAWFTSAGLKGHGYYTNPLVPAAANEAVYSYPNTQGSAPLWFHDHTLGATRLNVYAGLAGGYYLLDPVQEAHFQSIGMRPTTEVIPIVLQDRMFDTNGQLFFPADSAGGVLAALNPQHPYWSPGVPRRHHRRERQGVAVPQRRAEAVPVPVPERLERAHVRDVLREPGDEGRRAR